MFSDASPSGVAPARLTARRRAHSRTGQPLPQGGISGFERRLPNLAIGRGPAAIAGRCTAAALLLDLNEPHRIVRKSTEPILAPETDFERQGFVPNVLFPTGAIERDDTLLVYYGAADTVCAVAALSRSDILAATR